MPVLYHFPLDPASRFIRLIMGELQMEAEFIEERTHERRREFLLLNPAGELPVLVEHDGQVVPGAVTIAEYLDETRGLVLGDRRLLPEAPAARVEVRRLISWFGHKFRAEVSEPLVHEKIIKRLLPAEHGGGAPDPGAMRAARANIRYHLKYIAHLLRQRNWLAGDRLTYADLAAAAELSAVDYLGDVPWNEEEAVRHWYATVKSRPSFRPLLADRLRGVAPAAAYADLDF
ncbi:MAG: glutathione S-transferase family protein [Hyphomicrobiales bacterium]|uniref:glutathione S-transferase family protein n=1 Tax=Rhabdaerophilum calidifontis TaxID=2604328 RepID=UPI00123A1D4A|nr:glutathione S-transferase family protein [Rhabdaerophilum calidifontis]MCA1951607.1 glutathione S-transferase family protein [Hyphomicrobiales bacterium]MCA1998809.1 glutathione S-transferase family protein [Hyphomicrobiales bacterium]